MKGVYSFRWKCHTPEIHRIEKLRSLVFRGTNSDRNFGPISIGTVESPLFSSVDVVGSASVFNPPPPLPPPPPPLAVVQTQTREKKHGIKLATTVGPTCCSLSKEPVLWHKSPLLWEKSPTFWQKSCQIWKRAQHSAKEPFLLTKAFPPKINKSINKITKEPYVLTKATTPKINKSINEYIQWRQSPMFWKSHYTWNEIGLPLGLKSQPSPAQSCLHDRVRGI